MKESGSVRGYQRKLLDNIATSTMATRTDTERNNEQHANAARCDHTSQHTLLIFYDYGGLKDRARLKKHGGRGLCRSMIRSAEL